MQKLSIIIPCYNCEKTLEEAVESCFIQNLEDFEIIMVNDASTDNTQEVIKSLAEKYKEIKVICHDKNKGGGATRNTGIKNCTGEYIYCLDSDNILYPGSLIKMLDFLVNNKVDGVVFYERRFFHSKNIKYYNSHYNPINKMLSLENVFDSSGVLLDNFLYTKKSFLKAKGYPEHHGFDTQCFEMRYLGAQNKVLTCPDTIFYHRQSSIEPSYFEREFNKGNYSLNYYLAIEDIWHLLSAYAKKKIINYDIFKKSDFKENLLAELKKIYKDNKLFNSQDTNPTTDSYILYDAFITNFQNRKFREALNSCSDLLDNKITSKLIYYNILRSSLGLTIEDFVKIEAETEKIIVGLKTEQKILNRWYHKNLFTLKVVTIIHKILKNEKN